MMNTYYIYVIRLKVSLAFNHDMADILKLYLYTVSLKMYKIKVYTTN